jgi:DtxR family Mn-dependent transcriptional regulator
MRPDPAEVHHTFPAAAEYLSGIYILCRDYGRAANTRLSRWLGVSASAVTQALSRLKRLALVRQERYGEITLTRSGRLLAVEVLRRHYLLEHLLVRILEYPWEKSDREAKLLQSLVSKDLVEHLGRRLGSPQACPHGNPMPGSSVEARLLGAPTLLEASEGQTVTILRITEEGEQVRSLLTTCSARGVRPGARFRVHGRDRKNLLLSRDGRRVSLPLAMARHIRFECRTRPKTPA